MGALAKLEASYSARSVDFASQSGFSLLGDGTGLGHPVETPLFAQTFDGEALLATSAPKGSREQKYTVLIAPAAGTVAALQTALDLLDRVLDDVTSQGGGSFAYRSASGSFVTRWRVAAGKRSPVDLAEYERFKRARVTISLVCEPFGLADPLDVFDGFATDTLGTAGLYNPGGSDWTKVSGASASIAGGVLTAPNTTGLTIYTHTGSPNTYGDAQVTTKPVFTTRQTNAVAAVVVKWIDASNYIYARILDDGANSILSIRKVTAGSDAALTTPVTVNLATRVASAGAQWLRARIEGNVVFAENWLAQPTPIATPTDSVSGTLSSAEAAIFGATIRGRVGIAYNGIGLTTITFDDFDVKALAYRNVTFPQTLRLEGAWGGTADALAGIYYTGSGGTAPTAMLYAWWPRVAAHNMVWNGGAEVVGTTASVAYGWVATAVAGVIAAATTVVRTTTAASIRTGSAAFECATPATTDTGASFIIHRRGGFRKGVTYTASCYARAASGTTAVRVKLGISGDLGTGTAAALSTTFALFTTTWTCAADAAVAYFAIGVNAATATTFQFDDVVVYEGTTAPTSEIGGHGPGIILGNAYNAAKASISSDGSYWTGAVDATFLGGYRVRGTGAMTTTANLEFPILPHLFTPDDYTRDEVDVAVFARIELPSTQTSASCAISMASERGTSYGARRYGSFRSGGRTLKLPSSGTAFKPYFLGIVTLKVDRTRPRREWLRLAFTNSGAATGTFSLDYLVVVPVRSCARTRSGSSASITPTFIASTAETTKVIGLGTEGDIVGDPLGGIVEWTGGLVAAVTPDDGLGGESLRLPPDGAELLVWPSDQIVDLADSSAASMALSHAGTVQVAVQPRVHLLRQS